MARGIRGRREAGSSFLVASLFPVEVGGLEELCRPGGTWGRRKGVQFDG